MSAVAQFLALAAIEVAGLFAIWLMIKSKVRRYLELDSLLAGVRDEARALVLELNETADRNVTLVEDRMGALRSMLDEVDRRLGIERRETESRAAEREVYAKLSRRRPIVPEAGRAAGGPAAPAPPPPSAPTPSAPPLAAKAEAPITLSLGASAEGREPERTGPEVRVSDEPIAPVKTRREEALELYRRGISAELIATRLGATVAEIELLVELEERRAAADGRNF